MDWEREILSGFLTRSNWESVNSLYAKLISGVACEGEDSVRI